MKETALITGASSGLGVDFAWCFAKDGINLVLVARRADRLNELAKELERNYSISARVMVKDLSDEAEVDTIFDELMSEGIQVDYLINNAGFGDVGNFLLADRKAIAGMMDVNMKALTMLTRDFLPSMVQRKSGKIMLVASTASFQPGPGMAVYFATKSYVRSLGEALSEELKNTGVSLTVLCPGPTKTEFIDLSGMKSISLVSLVSMPTSKEVAQYGYNALRFGKRTAVHGFLNKLGSKLVNVIPTGITLRVLHKLLHS